MYNNLKLQTEPMAQAKIQNAILVDEGTGKPQGILHINLATRNLLDVKNKEYAYDFVTNHKDEIKNNTFQKLLNGVIPEINFGLKVDKYSLDTKKDIDEILSGIQGLHFSYSDLLKKGELETQNNIEITYPLETIAKINEGNSKLIFDKISQMINKSIMTALCGSFDKNFDDSKIHKGPYPSPTGIQQAYASELSS